MGERIFPPRPDFFGLGAGFRFEMKEFGRGLLWDSTELPSRAGADVEAESVAVAGADVTAGFP